MPSGFERLNARKSQPNGHIAFIKPLKGPDETIAQDFLQRIAAQCLPVMREHHLFVTSLEQYEPNREFVGRNFNAGEVIQLVLKSLSGKWLPFDYVQMVMMHELAHCKQMNHSRAFWAVRNRYADQMRTLWSRGFTGEGLWGRGALLGSGEYEKNTLQSIELLPEAPCGGAYKSGPRKRKPKKQLSYRERKERRILKKFGANGVTLGDDEDVKTELEKGKKTQAKPRVAGSKRGRELRAAAALARFDKQKEAEEKQSQGIHKKESDDGESDIASDDDDDDEEDIVIDINGQRLMDTKGNRLVRVCEDENPQGDDARNERRELLQSSMPCVKLEARSSTPPMAGKPPNTRPENRYSIENWPCESKKSPSGKATDITAPVGGRTGAGASAGICPLCSFDSGCDATICGVCSHVLNRAKVPDSWKCTAVTCRGSLYLNAGDVRICGVCGQRRDPQM
ncbi:WLM-domain-containing protein [Durotheca rogersii]|uniref:WLM-domain-containing protein n=1 Tax=Durotheca rogersii TaxID=419775 RepID=UPI002220F59B|nr:WLM-domain-containing protein [Durotheca rogersii]KAI5866956.1 WLM-domain-containing protein [Durotheca rogersii]